MTDFSSLTKVFESLHIQYQSMVLQLCLGYMKGDIDLANDIAQEVFINVWISLPAFRNLSSPKTWIYRITVNTCLLYIRSDKKKEIVSLDQTSVHCHALTERYEKGDKYSLYRAIGDLQELDRIIIMLVLEELKYEEITKITGIGSANLRVRIHRIKQKLKQLLIKTVKNG